MTVAKMRIVGKKIKKKIKTLIFPPASKTPGQVDYPVVPELIKRKKKLKELIEE